MDGPMSATPHAARPRFDLTIRGGRVVTATSDQVADIGIRGGLIEAIGSIRTSVEPGERVIDATGKLVFPGGIDAHVHVTPVELPNRRLAWADDFGAASAAAAAGGITTIGDITFPKLGESPHEAAVRVEKESARHSIIDYLLHPVLFDPSPSNIGDIGNLSRDGFGSLKIFMNLGDFDGRTDEYLSALRAAATHGMVVLIHCEDGPITRFLTQHLVAEGRSDLSNFPATRPEYAYVAAVHRALAYAEATGATIYLVHVSSAAVLGAIQAARSRGVSACVETRPIYLLFTDDVYSGQQPGLFIGNPPIRTARDQEALWDGLAAGLIDTCCTDHAPWTRKDKLEPGLDITNTRPGMADLEFMMPTLFSEGVRKGRLPLERFVEITSTNAARIFGIFPAKGTIAVGSDADLVVWDPTRTVAITGNSMVSNAKHTVLEGRELTGWPSTTISRGEVVFANGRVAKLPGRGKRVRTTTINHNPTPPSREEVEQNATAR